MADTGSHPSADAVLAAVQDRQSRITSRLPWFAKVTIPVALFCFLAAFVVRMASEPSFKEEVTGFRISTVTVGALIAWILGVFSSIVVWVFVIWALFFVPYIAYHAHKASRDSKGTLTTRPLRWLQLYAATFLPTVVFATAWNTFSNAPSASVALRLGSAGDFVILLATTGMVVVVLAAINYLVPPRLAVVRLSIFSFLLYLSLFLAYGQGVNVASHAMVFGILIYLMFGASQIADLARRISLHDIDPRLVDRIEDIVTRHQEVRAMRHETDLTKQEHAAALAKHQLKVGQAEAESEVALGQQLAEIKTRKVNINREINQVQLGVIETRIDMLGKAFGVLAEEWQHRMKSEIPGKLKQLTENVRTLTPEQLTQGITGVLTEINESMKGIPESLAELRTQLLAAAQELEKQTRLLASDLDGESPSTSREEPE